MNETDRQAAISQYLEALTEQFYSGQAREHTYRPALERLMNSFDDTHASNEPKRSEHGAPDFIFLKQSNNKIIKGYAEAKDVTVSLDKTEKTEQMSRYAGYANLFLTDYLEFRFFRNGDKYQTISLGHVKDGKIYKTPENGERLMRELESFLTQAPEKITSGKRLAQIMGGKARRIRDNVAIYLKDETDASGELTRMYQMMREMLVHDLTEDKFADMYAQTLVYGLFVARYGDSTPDNFTRNEARDLVPASNPFLRHFFDHIVGPNFDTRLGYIVDELCEIFSVSDVQNIVHKHLRIQDSGNDAKDPIIHFYEDFLQEYDPLERRKMGAYYTPIPVVKFIVRNVDKILKEEFGIAKGIASDEKISYEVDTQPWRKKGERKDRLTKMIETPRVQILDPAVGTATFLNETIKFIHEEFKGQEGRWPAYVADNLVKRLHGFELMMAPYTIAHLKLGMTLRETGVEQLSDRLGVYLTNTLEEGIPQQPDLFSFGLAEAVSDESRHAADIKSERPVMVVMGNPPYSGESSNNTKFANELSAKYKIEPSGLSPLKERTAKWINDDYVKFISFAETMIERNNSGVVAMITNHAYLDNPTFRGMRWHLRKTFDKIYVLDLHGNSKKKETTPDGKKDENVFDIQQGVSIIIAVKNKKGDNDLADVFHADLWGKRKEKFIALGKAVSFEQITPHNPYHFFTNKDVLSGSEYNTFISVRNLFLVNGVGVTTAHDDFVIDQNSHNLLAKFTRFKQMSPDAKLLHSEFDVKTKKGWDIIAGWKNIQTNSNLNELIKPISYRPFDDRYIFYEDKLVWRTVKKVMNHLEKPNLALLVKRQSKQTFSYAFLTDKITESCMFESAYANNSVLPLYIYHQDGTRTPNFNPTELSTLTRNLTAEPSPEDILDYIYAVLHSPTYRTTYKEFLKIDFPRVPAPTSDAEFTRLVALGRELRELHLMKSPALDSHDTTFPVVGSDEVEKLTYTDNKVWINNEQYFGNVPETAWNFYIGGYQPAQKWLKDRLFAKTGRALTNDDLDHYQKIVKILLETNRIMKEIS